MSDLSLQHHLSHSQQLADTLHHLLHQHPDHTLPLVVVLADRDFIDAAPGRNQACRQRALHLAAQCQMAGGTVQCVLESLLPPQRGLAHQLQARHAGCASHASAAAQLAALQLTLGARHCHAPDELAEHVDQLLAGHPMPSQPRFAIFVTNSTRAGVSMKMLPFTASVISVRMNSRTSSRKAISSGLQSKSTCNSLKDLGARFYTRQLSCDDSTGRAR